MIKNMQVDNILVGYVKHFKYLSKEAAEKFPGVPAKNKVYRILETKANRVDDDEAVTLYQVYIGKDSNKSGMDAIFLGESLSGNYNDKWEFDITLIDHSNFADFSIGVKDLKKVHEWLKTDHKELKELLNGKTAAPVDVTKKSVLDETPTDKASMVEKALSKVMDFDKQYDQSMISLSQSLNTIVGRDTNFAMVTSDLATYIASTYKDKYEDAGKTNISRDFLMSSNSPDVALFNTLKYLQRYTTQGYEKSGNINDLYKAIHYIMFELQRKKFIND